MTSENPKKRKSILSSLESWSTSEEEGLGERSRPAEEKTSRAQVPASQSPALASTSQASGSSSGGCLPKAPSWVRSVSNDYVAEHDFNEERARGIEICVPRPADAKTCGSILKHCRSAIDAFIELHGGRQLCTFKIGIATGMIVRYESYLDLGYDHMRIVMLSHQLAIIEMLEAACIALYEDFPGNRAKNLGGDGGLSKRTHYLRHPGLPVFFLYIAGVPANVTHPIDIPRSRWAPRQLARYPMK